MGARDARDVIIRPVISEKSYAQMDENTYTFVVHPDANKIEIRHAVESIFGVTVKKVNTLTRHGKRRRNRRTGIWSKLTDERRAIVKVAEGDRIDLFEV